MTVPATTEKVATRDTWAIEHMLQRPTPRRLSPNISRGGVGQSSSAKGGAGSLRSGGQRSKYDYRPFLTSQRTTVNVAKAKARKAANSLGRQKSDAAEARSLGITVEQLRFRKAAQV